MNGKSKRLRNLFHGDKLIRAMGAHSALSAKIAENSGFDCIWASGLEISTSCGVPDANILTMTDLLNAAVSMNEAVSIPIIADCDTGFGNSNNVIHMVKKYESAGIAAVCIEDKHFPKVNSFIPGRQELAPLSEFVGKILAAKNAQVSKDFFVFARVEALIAGWGMDEALKRANAYADAGADAVLIHSKSKTIDEIMEFAKLWQEKVPLVVVPTTYFNVNIKELEKMKIRMTIYANHGIRSSIRAMQETMEEIHRTGSSASVENKITPMSEVFELQGMHKMKEEELNYASTTGESFRAIIPAAGDHLAEYSMKHIFSDIPISMLDINGKPLLQRQVEVLNRCKVYDIYCVGGYRKEKIEIDGVKVISNPDYQKTGILDSLMCAAEEIQGKVLVIYGDVLFDHTIINRILDNPEDITILVDSAYDSKQYGPGKRLDLVMCDGQLPKTRRRFHKDALIRVKKIGINVNPRQAQYEFPGIMAFSKTGSEIFKNIYRSSQLKYKGRKFHGAEAFERADIADLLQEVIDLGYPVHCIEINSGWLEIHSLDNYKLACSIIK